jgi:hypothetical protein
MRTMERVGAALSLALAGAAVAADRYALREDVAPTGTNIVRAAVVWPVPINRSYEELTGEQKNLVRDEYVKLGARDEPPYPLEGMTPILRELAKVSAQDFDSGLLHLAVRVDANGHPLGVAVLASPNRNMEEAMGLALLDATYKAAKCDGKPCEGDFSFKYRFELERHHTARTYWNPAMWTPSPSGVHY